MLISHCTNWPIAPIFSPTRSGRPRAGLGNTKDMKMNVARTFNNWRKYRQTRNELARMSDRELSDIGVNRADIARIARQAI